MSQPQIICLKRFGSVSQIAKYEKMGYVIIDTTSHAEDFWKQLSPFFLKTENGIKIENFWQYSKIYPMYFDGNSVLPETQEFTWQNESFHVHAYEPNPAFLNWQKSGFESIRAIRYPMGKGAKPVCALYEYNHKHYMLDYIQSRKLIYIPEYAKAVSQTYAFQLLSQMVKNGTKIALLDFDGYNNYDYNMSLNDVINCSYRKMGHSFVIAMLLTQFITL